MAKNETVAFYARYKGYARPIKPATMMMLDNQMKTIPAVMAKFTNGFLRTNDPETIEVLSDDPHCYRVGDEEIKKIRQGKLQFKGNMTLENVSQGDPHIQKRLDEVERKNAALAEKNKQLEEQAGDIGKQGDALEDAEHELDRLDKENARLKKEADDGNKASRKVQGLEQRNSNLQAQIDALKKQNAGGPGTPGPNRQL